jgi:hypothetical protein
MKHHSFEVGRGKLFWRIENKAFAHKKFKAFGPAEESGIVLWPRQKPTENTRAFSKQP